MGVDMWQRLPGALDRTNNGIDREQSGELPAYG
jgi:hypothetical protein